MKNKIILVIVVVLIAFAGICCFVEFNNNDNLDFKVKTVEKDSNGWYNQ